MSLDQIQKYCLTYIHAECAIFLKYRVNVMESVNSSRLNIIYINNIYFFPLLLLLFVKGEIILNHKTCHAFGYCFDNNLQTVV